MDRNRDARRASIVGSNGFNRRRHRTNFPEEDGGPELRERVKKDRDRDLRERGRERDFIRERSSRSKRRRADRFTAGDDSSDESVNDDEEEDGQDQHALPGDSARFSSPPAGSISNQNHHLHGGGGGGHSSSFSQQQHNNNSNSSNIVSSNNNNNNHHLQHRKTFPPSSSSSTAKVVRPPPVWKPGDEMISVSVPRKARSASTKRSHDWISSSNNSGSGDPSPAQPSSSPARQTPAPPLAQAAAPTSPSSSNAAVRKKLKHGLNINPTQKLKPPKASPSSAKPSSSNPEDLEIEIAEVLYGLMTQSHGPPSSSRDINRLNGDGKSLNSSPIANSISTNHNSNSPLSAVAPKRKRPRQVPEGSGPGFGVRSSPLSLKLETQPTDQTSKSEISSLPNPEVISGSAVENVPEMRDISVISQAVPAGPVKLDSESKAAGEKLREGRDLINGVKYDVSSSKDLESLAVRDQDRNNRDSPSTVIASVVPKTINPNIVSEDENQKEEKFEIDLMAPPRQIRPSPKSETKTDMTASAVVDQKPALSTLVADSKLPQASVSKDNEDEKSKIASGNNNHSTTVAAAEGKKPGEGELNKAVENKGRNLDFRLDLEKPERDVCSSFSANENISQLPTQKHQQPLKLSQEEQPLMEKPGHLTSSLPLTMPVASWPGGLPPMGYMAPLQGVVTPAHIQPLFSQPRSKRCATHCHIARNIHCLQQFMKMNPFWPAPSGSPAAAASMFGSKPCGNLSAMPPASDLNVTVRGVNYNAQDNKGPTLACIPNNGGKEKGSQQENSSDSAQRKPQILIQQTMPSVAPTNLLGPTFIIPINQQQAGARPGPTATKSPSTTAAPSNAVASASATPSSTSFPGSMSFNYPNMSPNETQYLAILQNSAYPFTIPTVGPSPNYRGGPPAQAMPLFNGSFYSSQIMHQQLQHSQQQPSNQPPQMMQAHHNTSAGQMMQAHHNTSAGQMMQAHHNVSAGNNSLSSQKQQQIQSQQQQLRSQNSFSSQKAQPPPHSNHYMQSGGNDDNSSSSMADNRGSRATSVNIYGQNFAMPIHPQNFSLMTHTNVMAGANSSNQAEKKSSSQPQQQHQGMKTGVVESLPPHTFAMSFGPGMDGASMAQSHAMFQNCADGARQNMQMMAAAASAQAAQKNNFRISEEAKSGNSGNHDNSFAKEDERKSFAFSDTRTAASIQANNNSVLTRNSRPATSNGPGTMNAVQNAHLQAQLQQQQQQQMLKLKHHHQQQKQMATNTANRTNKPPVTSNGSIYSEHLNTSPAMGGNFPNTVSPVFPQNHVQSSSSSPSQSPQWKSSTRTPTTSSQPGPSSLGSSTQMMHKNLPQQHSRSQPPMHAQISFGGNQKQPATPSQGQGPPPSGHPGPSSPMMVGSPTTSLSKGTSGSPRTNSSASTTNNKTAGHHASPFSAQPPKNSPSILGNPKAQMQQQSQQKNMQQAHLFFSNPYSQPPHLTSLGHAASGPVGYSVPQRRVPSGTSTNDPTTAIAAATSNAKGVSPFGLQSTGTLLPAGFSYVHPVPSGVQVKPAEQKQPAGNDNLHKWQPEKK